MENKKTEKIEFGYMVMSIREIRALLRQANEKSKKAYGKIDQKFTCNLSVSIDKNYPNLNKEPQVNIISRVQ